MTEFNPYDIETNFYNNDVCSICQENMTEENYYAIPECGHIFHTNCIITWFRSLRPNCPLCNDCGINLPIDTHGQCDYYNTISMRAKGENLYKLRNSKKFPTSSKIQKIIARITNIKQKIVQNKKYVRVYKNISFNTALAEGLDTPKKIQTKRYQLRRKSWSLSCQLRKQYSILGAVPIVHLIIPRIVNVNE